MFRLNFVAADTFRALTHIAQVLPGIRFMRMIAFDALDTQPLPDAAWSRRRFQLLGLAPQKRKDTMTLHLALTPLISLIAGILILIIPRLLNFIVAIYLIVIGLVGLFGAEHLLR
jgi:hypothetical protein